MNPLRSWSRAVFAFAALIASGVIFATGGPPGLLAAGSAPSSLPVMDDAKIRPMFRTIGSAAPLPTTRTIAHWFTQATDQHNGLTYGLNMVGADPNHCAGAGCSVTIEADITPIIVRVDGVTLDATEVVPATLASPVFALNDYGFTPFATTGGPFSNLARGAGGVLLQGDGGIPLQLQDATMRAQFNKTGSSSYHLRLHPNVLPPVTIDVPTGQGFALQSGRGVAFANVAFKWWTTQILHLQTSADPTHLATYLGTNVVLEDRDQPAGCCIIGFHGVGSGSTLLGSPNSNGNAPVQTLVWATWMDPGLLARANGGTLWAVQDIHALSHEVAEWASDPFASNAVEPWQLPGAPGFCVPLLETGDPVVYVGFAMGSNMFEQGPDPDGSQSADGYYHPEDEVLLPWFMRTAPNMTSEPTQSASANTGRYSLLGDLNPFSEVHQPATGC